MTKDKFQAARDEVANAYANTDPVIDIEIAWAKGADWAREFLTVEWQCLINLGLNLARVDNAEFIAEKLRAENAKLREANNVYFNTSNDLIEIFIREPKDPHAISQRLFIGPGQGIDFSITPLARAALGEKI